jgi:hypothetical protein
MGKRTCYSSIGVAVHSQPTSYGKKFCTRCLNGWEYHAGGSIQCVTVQPVPCSQTVQHRLWCRSNCGTVTHASRWEFTAALSETNSAMRLRIGQHASNGSQPSYSVGRETIAMLIPKRWSTTDLDTTGIVLQRLGCLSVGTPWMGFRIQGCEGGVPLHHGCDSDWLRSFPAG